MKDYEIEAVLIINAYLARHGIFTRPALPTSDDAAAINSVYSNFLNSSYNLPYRPLRVCLESYLEYLYSNGGLVF